jgi:hypothetical protein
MFQLSLLSEKKSTLEHKTQHVVPHGLVSHLACENGSIGGVILGASAMASYV